QEDDQESVEQGINFEASKGLVEKIDDSITLKIIEDDENEEDETETIDLSSFDADLNVIDENVESTEDTEYVAPSMSVSPSEEEEIYSSLKDEMQKKKEEEKPQGETELKEEVKTVLSYLDQLLDALPEEKIKEFAESKTFDLYRKLFDELNIKH
nr:hypothetical protein [Spirochaetota bacterium]